MPFKLIWMSGVVVLKEARSADLEMFMAYVGKRV